MMHHRSILLSLAFVIFALIFATAAFAADAAAPADSPIVAKCKADLDKRLKEIRLQDIKFVESKPTVWPDASLGMPVPGKMYAQVLTPGSRVTLKAGNTTYFYATSNKAIKYGGTVEMWNFSMLYTKPAKNDPNLNGDLYQCSLLGTNCVRLVSGVSDIYPQESGKIIFTQRTSRSGFDLYLLNAADPKAKPRKLHSAFAFAGAALDDMQDRWAALVRPRVGASWTVLVAPLAGEAKPLVIAVPADVKPEQIAWSEGKIMILSKRGPLSIAHEFTPSDAKAEWKPVGAHLFPLTPDYMLNKSEHLDISERELDGKVGVEVASVWFTGDRNVIARIEGLKLTGETLLPWGYAFIWGQKDNLPAVYTVDISTGETIPATIGSVTQIRPFRFPPRSTPLPPAPAK